MVDCSSLALTVGTVIAVVTSVGSAFVKLDSVMSQRVNKNFNGTRNFAFGVGILYAQEQNTVTLVRHAL